LLQLLRPLQRKNYLQWIRPVIIITGLWLFTLLAGAQPSILRSALMFTCIILGESLSKKSNIYNTLAFSAIVLLCINPYWLWDVGFQLSYAAVLSIILFFQPVYNWFYIKNRIFDFVWKLTAVTIAAQILTLPVSIYHFHQFPLYFLLTNFVAVPLSSVILIGEIFLIAISFIPTIAIWIGKALYWLIWLMNEYIEKIESFRYSLLDGFQINIPQTIFLYVSVAGIGCWLLEKRKSGLKIGLAAFMCFAGLRSYSFWQAEKQQKLIVYNVPQHQAIDFINGRQFVFKGDSNLLNNDFARNFHLKPSRVLYRIEQTDSMQNLFSDDDYASFVNKRILLIDSTTYFAKSNSKTDVDLLVISRNPKLYISRLSQSFTIKQVVFDGSASPGKLKYWKRDCDSLHVPYHDVSEKGAFVMTLN
jgi:competence protein ComEC